MRSAVEEIGENRYRVRTNLAVTDVWVSRLRPLLPEGATMEVTQDKMAIIITYDPAHPRVKGDLEKLGAVLTQYGFV